MAKQLNVNLAFTADTSQARAQVQDLQNQLTQLIQNSGKNTSQLGITSEIKEATMAVAQLKTHLQNATNVQTGTLDFTKLNQSIQQSGQSLTAYASNLKKLGPEGQQAFQSLASAVAQSEIPLRRTNAALSEMWVTLKNTARWQLSSTALHAFMGTIQSAYGYAQDLNESLNNIRIVTGYSTQEMAQFAEQANKAAKQLNTTTTAYTNASLIYYQQGLSDDEVQQRTDITVKMANVSRESAQIVSDQMTAVWNNFADGSKSLEYYADVMTALGAATASSTAEISAGLEKFAAIAETVGLSYEYSTAALATITATTRQSADVVGNALKTLFARIQGLSLGETLEDGVDLNKYSEALAKIGVNVLDANGNMREMDDILDDMASKWDTLGKAEQTALAQTVAGVRQYTQLVALMDNWDFMQQNLETAYGATGSLQKQADIYAESWEAAQKRVQSAAESLYSDLLNDEFFIDMLNMIENILSGIDGFIDGIGGLKGVLLGLGVVASKVFEKQIAQGLSNMAYSIKMSTEAGEKQIENERVATLNKFQNMMQEGEYPSQESSQRAANIRQELELQQQLTSKAKEMSDIELQTSQILLDNVRMRGERVALAKKEEESIKNQLSDLVFEAQAEAVQGTNNPTAAIWGVESSRKNVEWSVGVQALVKDFNQLQAAEGKTEEVLERILNSLKEANTPAFDALAEDLTKASISGENLDEVMALIYAHLEELISEQEEFLGANFEKIVEGYRNSEKAARKTKEEMSGLDIAVENVRKSITDSKGNIVGWGNSFVQAAGQISSLMFGLQQLSTIATTLKNPDLTGWEKFTTIMIAGLGAMTSLSAGVQGLTKVYALLKIAKEKDLIVTGLNTAAEFLNAAAKGASVKSVWDSVKSRISNAKAINEETKGLIKQQTVLRATKGKDGKTYYSLNGKRISKAKALELAPNIQPDQIKNINFLGQAIKTFGKALFNVTKSTAPYLAAVAAIVIAAQAIHAWWNKDADAADKAAQAAEKATSAYEKISQKAIAFKESVSDYKNAVSGLKDLTKGTQEYSDAVEAANKKAKELIETNNLYGDYYYDSDGLIQFKDGVLKEIQATKDLAAAKAENIMNMAKMNSVKANESLYKTETIRENRGFKQMDNGASYWVGRDLMEEAAKAYSSFKEDNQGNESFKDYLKNGKDFSLALKNSADFFGGEFQPTVIEFSNKIEEASQAVEYFSKEILKNKIEQDYGDQVKRTAANEQQEDLIYGAIASQTDVSLVDQLQNKPNYASMTEAKRRELINIETQAGYSRESQMRYWAEMQGEYTADQIEDFVYTKDENGIDTLKDKKGNTIYSVDKNTVQTDILEQNYIDDILQSTTIEQDSVNKVLGAVKNIRAAQGDDTVNAILSALNNNWENIDLSNAFGDFNLTEFENIQSATPGQGTIAKALGLTQEDIEAMGTTLDQFESQVKDSLKENWTFEKFTEGANKKGSQLAEQYGLDVEEFESYRDLLLEQNKALKDQPELLNKIAIANKRYQKGVDKIAKSYKDWDKIIKKGNLNELSQILPELNDAVQDMLNLDDNAFEKLSPDFAAENWDLITKAMNGSEEAYEQLQAKAAQEIVLGAKFDADGIDESEQAIIDKINALQAEDVVIGTHFDNSQAAQDLFDLMMEQEKTVDQMKDAFNDLGWNPDLGYEEMTIDEAASNGSYTNKQVWVPNADGMGWHQVTLTDAASMGMDGSTVIRVPKIGSDFKKVSSGGGGYKPTTDPGGGGGGSKKTPEKKTADKGERYHTLTNQLEDIKKEYDAISEAADRAFGKDKLKLIDDQIAKLDEEKEKQEELIDAVKENLAIDKGEMEARLSAENSEFNFEEYYKQSDLYQQQVKNGQDTFDFKVEYDANGNITNYDEIEQSMIAAYNTAAESGMSDEEWEAFQKKYDAFWESLEQYESTYDKLKDEEAELQAQINERLDLQLEKIQYEVELEISVSQDSLDYLDYQLSKIEDDAFAAAEKISLIGQEMNELSNQAAVYRNGIEEILADSVMSESDMQALLDGDLTVLDKDGVNFTEAQVDSLKDYRNNLLAINQQYKELKNTVQNQVMEAFDAWMGQMDEGINKISTYGEMIQSYRNIVDIVGKDLLGISDEFLAEMSQASIDNAILEIGALQDKYEAIEAARQEAQAALERALEEGSEEDVKYWQEQVKTLTEQSAEAFLEIASSQEEALQLVYSAFEQSVNAAMDKFNEAVYAMGGLEGLSEEFNRQQEMADMYLKDYEQIYELSKLNRNINNSIDDTKSIAGKQKLKKLLEEINEIQESGLEMSEYDLEYLQAEYDLRLAEIALEEAQNAKDTVRLQKDNEGNWSYVYTSTTDAVDEAQQKYEDALFSMQELSSNYINEMSEQMIQTSQEMAEALASLRIEDYATEEEYHQARQKIMDDYNKKLAAQEAELNKAIANNKTLYDTDVQNWTYSTGQKQQASEDFITSYSESILGMLMGSQSETSDFSNVIAAATDQLMQDLTKNAQLYWQNVESVMQAGEDSTEDFADKTKEELDKIKTAAQGAAMAVKLIKKEMDEEFPKILESVEEFQKKYREKIQPIIDANEDVVKSINDILRALSIDPDSITYTYESSDESEEEEESPEEYATGGYTGAWGDSGKLAVLHEKEIVLNADDTSNLLNTVALTKQMLQTIDLNAQHASLGVGNIGAVGLFEEKMQALEQYVHITADFPNVSDHSEIEMALNDLINTAAQYSNRKGQLKD